MNITATLGANQVLSHGFGMYLFAALFPLMRDDLNLTYWHFTAVGVATQLAYLAGALSIGELARRYAPEKLVLWAGLGSSSLLFSLSVATHAIVLICILALLAFCAAICWGSIVGVISQRMPKERAASALSASGSGTAWGYGINGLLLALWIPLWGWQATWALTSLIGFMCVLLTFKMVRSLNTKINSTNVNSTKVNDSTATAHIVSAYTTKQLIKATLTELRARLNFVMHFLIGLSCITFASWLNTYLSDLDATPTLVGTTWTVIGVSGMVSGIAIGKLADKKGHVLSLLVMCTGFTVSLAAFCYNPIQFSLLAGVGYGMIYFPIWGIISSWVAQAYPPVITMQFTGFAMLACALGATTGNILAGVIQDLTGSVALLFPILTVASSMLLILSLYIAWQAKKPYCMAEIA